MTSRLVQMQARFQQRQMEEREEKLLKVYESQQQRAFERVGRGSAPSNTSVVSTGGGGKVRQMFDEQRHQKAGVDRSYPLQPLKSKSSTAHDRSKSKAVSTTLTSTSNSTTTRTTAFKAVSQRTQAVTRTVTKVTKNGTHGTKETRLENTNTRRTNNAISNNNPNNNHRAKGTKVNDEVDASSDSHRDLIVMMNKHSLNDNLEDEEVPNEFDDSHAAVDEDYGDVDQLNGNHNPVYGNSVVSKKSGLTPEPKPIVRRSIVKSVSSPTGKATLNSRRASNNSATIAAKPPSQDMIKHKKAEKAPSSSRPSAKQPPRSPVMRDDLAECKYCGRRFASDRLDVHEDICAKTGKKKRKTYDATKHRLLGTDLEPYVKKGGKSVSSKSNKAPPKKDWRKTHEEFVATIRAAKLAQEHIAKGGKLSDLPPPPPSSNPDYIQCPHCGRRFNETAAERHIPKCASFQFNKPKATPSKGKATGKK